MAAENELNKPKQTATYIDESGQKQTGVYTQAAENAGLADSKAASQPAQGSHWDTMQNYYQQMYDQQTAANNAAYEAAAERAREAAQHQIDTLNQGYQGTNRQLYRDYMQHQRTLPQEMAARGYSGGLSESAQLRLRNSYEEGLNENERARLGQISGANANLAQQLYEAQATATAANQQANQQRLGYLTQLQEQQYQDLQQRAATLASAGDFSGYEGLGYSPEQVSYLESVWARQNPALAYSMGKIDAGTYYKLTGAYPPGYSAGGSGGGSGGSGGGSTYKKYYDAAMAAYKDGASLADINADISRAVSAGKISNSSARKLIGQISSQPLNGRNNDYT